MIATKKCWSLLLTVSFCAYVPILPGKPRHVTDSKVMSATLKSEDAVPAVTPVEAKMQMQVCPDGIVAGHKRSLELRAAHRHQSLGCTPCHGLGLNCAHSRGSNICTALMLWCAYKKQVVDKMLAKKKSVRDIFVKMTRDKDGRVPLHALRDEYVTRHACNSPPTQSASIIVSH